MATTNRVGEIVERLDKSVSRDDLMLTVKKLRGFVEEQDQRTSHALNKQLSDLTLAMKSLSEQVKGLQEGLIQRDQVQQKALDDVRTANQQTKNLERVLEKSISSLRKELLGASEDHAKAQERWLNKRLETVSGLQGDRMESLHKAFEMGAEAMLEKVKALFAILPAPQTTLVIPESAIRIEQSIPQVSVNVPQQAAPVVNVQDMKLLIPDKAFNLHVDQPAPQVILPEKALQIHVQQAAAPPVIISEKAFHVEVPSVINVPKMDSPIIHVNTPTRKRLVKHISYDDLSRPATIEEKEIAEED